MLGGNNDSDDFFAVALFAKQPDCAERTGDVADLAAFGPRLTQNLMVRISVPDHSQTVAVPGRMG